MKNNSTEAVKTLFNRRNFYKFLVLMYFFNKKGNINYKLFNIVIYYYFNGYEYNKKDYFKVIYKPFYFYLLLNSDIYKIIIEREYIRVIFDEKKIDTNHFLQIFSKDLAKIDSEYEILVKKGKDYIDDLYIKVL